MAAQQYRFTASSGGDSFNDAAASSSYKYRDLSRQQPGLLPLPHPASAPSASPLPSYLALMTTGLQAYSYDLSELGHPHHQSPSQPTEPFWHQYDQVQQFSLPPHKYPTFGYTHYNFIYDPFSMQDFVPVFIGSNTANGKKLAAGEPSRRPQYRGDALMKPFGRVSVFIGDAYIDHARVQELMRFSKVIASKFYKKQQDEQSEVPGADKLGFSIEVTGLGQGGRAVTLTNSHSKIWVAPSAWAFAELLRWMYNVRSFPREADLPQLGHDLMQECTLHELIDVYAASLVLDLRPKAVMNTLRGHLIKHLAYHPSTASDFQYLHEHLPVGDIVLKKMIDTFFMHGERFHYKHRNLRGEIEKVQEYVNGCGHEEFRELVIGTMQARNEANLAKLPFAKGQRKGKGVAGKGAEGGQAANASGKAQASSSAVEGMVEPAQTTLVKGQAVQKHEEATAGPASPKDSAVGSPAKETSVSV